MKHEIIELHDVQIIGIAKQIAFNEAKEECPKFWGEYVEKIIKPVIFEKQEPNALTDGRACSHSAESEQAPLCSRSIAALQKAAFDNGVGEFGLCTCDIPNHNCATCAEQNFGHSSFASLKAIFLAMPMICTSCSSIISCFILFYIFMF